MEPYPTYTFKDGSYAEVDGQPVVTQQFVPTPPTPTLAPTPTPAPTSTSTSSVGPLS